MRWVGISGFSIWVVESGTGFAKVFSLRSLNWYQYCFYRIFDCARGFCGILAQYVHTSQVAICCEKASSRL